MTKKNEREINSTKMAPATAPTAMYSSLLLPSSARFAPPTSGVLIGVILLLRFYSSKESEI